MTNKQKRQYRIRNWRDYNKALIGRGSLTLWIDSRCVAKWLSQERPARRGRRLTYTDLAVECCLVLREVYHLPLRATQGLNGKFRDECLSQHWFISLEEARSVSEA